MELVTPQIGLIFWMTITFLGLLLVMKKFIWPPILKTLKEREEFIDKSLRSAEDAKAEMSQLKAYNEKLLVEAREEREKILKEAREMKEKLISDAKKLANEESDRMIASARTEIEKEKMQALTDIKQQVASISLEIAEKVIRKELDQNANQEALVEEHLKKAQLN